jgi:hypothetical protein
MKRLLLFLIAAVALQFIACTKRGRVTMNAMRPADITVPMDIEHILLLDRSKPNEKWQIGLIEGILTGELPQEDEAAVQRALGEFNAAFQMTPRFTAHIGAERLVGNSLTSAFPPQLSDKELEELCKKYGAQAIIAVEVFDSDFIVTNGTRKTKRTIGEGDQKREIEVDEWYAQGVANTVMGIRFYDGIRKRVIDEQSFKQTNTWQAAAASKAEAIAKLISKSAATAQLSANIAYDYAHRIAPMPIQLNRMFYRKHRKAPAIEIGTRLADVDRWTEALHAWENGIGMADMKRAGYLEYNVAIAHEVLGDLPGAIQHAQDAYVKYNNKDARAYVSLLQSRQFDEERLKEQQ